MRRLASSTYSPSPFTSRALPEISANPSHPQGASLRLTSAAEGDQFAIVHLLQQCFPRFDESEFHSQQQRPGYDPRERLVLHQGNQIVGHIRCVPEQVWLSGRLVPVLRASEFALAPEAVDPHTVNAFFRFLDAAFVRHPAQFVVQRTSTALAQHLARFGWVPLSPGFESAAASETYLSHVGSSQPLDHPRSSPRRGMAGLWIRLMRQVETEALVSLYDHSYHALQCGTARSAQMWQWLLQRKAFDALYVAIRGGNKLALDDAVERIVGYAIVKDQRILEVIGHPEHAEVQQALVCRICSDLYEGARRTFRLEAPARHPLHRVLRGLERPPHLPPEEQILVRLNRPLQQLAERAPFLPQVALSQGLDLPLDLGLLVDGEKYCLRLGRHTAHLADGKLGRSYLELSTPQLVRLLLGDLPWGPPDGRAEVAASTQLALHAARRLFPYDPPWFPAIDQLPMQRQSD